MEKETNVKLEVGKRVLFHTSVCLDIFEGVVTQISPSGKLFKIGERWYSSESSLNSKGPIFAEILDELPGETSKEVTTKEEDGEKSWPRGPS